MSTLVSAVLLVVLLAAACLLMRVERTSAPSLVIATRDEGRHAGRPLSAAVRALVGAAIVVIVALVVSFIPPRDAVKQRWMFLDSSPSTAEAGWVVEQHAAATGGRALSKAPGPPAVMLVSSTPARDVRAMTRCKGDGCGLAFRIASDASYTVARLVGDRVELARIEGDHERLLGAAALSSGGSSVWQELVVEARGDAIRVAINGVRAIDAVDPLPAPPGGVGLWAPERAWFDELSVETFAASPQAIEVLPLLRQRS